MKTKEQVSISATIIPIIMVSEQEQTRRIEAAISTRAYEIFKKRGGMSWHELEDWRQAESELRSPLCFGMTTEDHTTIIRTDAGEFSPCSLEIWVAPRRITISGRPSARHLSRQQKCSITPEHRIFRSISLPFAVDCLTSRAAIANSSLEIRLRQAAANLASQKSEQRGMALAARR